MHKQQRAFENIVGKEEIAPNEQLLLFPQGFLLNYIIVPYLSIFLTSYLSLSVHIFDIIVLFAAELEEPKICI